MQEYLDAAVQAARRAGELIRERLGAHGGVETKSTEHDLVTAVDRAAEESILALLQTAFPEVPILGEEGVQGQDAPTAGDHLEQFRELWLVDPLDGTTNFVYGLPFSAVSIALARQGRLAAAVVHDPYRDETFTAVAGGGAALNGRPIRVADTRSLSEAVLATGFSVRAETRQSDVEGLRALSPRCRNIRAFGSAALHLAYVAAGRLSGFWEIGLAPWDMAAGALLVAEAGGRVTDTIGRPYGLQTRHIVATTGPFHHEVLFILRQAGATGY